MKENNNKSKRISLQVSQELLERIDDAIYIKRVNRSELIRIAIIKYLKELENDSVS